MIKANGKKKKPSKLVRMFQKVGSNILVSHWLKLLQQFTSVTDDIQAP